MLPYQQKRMNISNKNAIFVVANVMNISAKF